MPAEGEGDCVELFETVGNEAGRDSASCPLRIPNTYFLRENFAMEDYVARLFCEGFGLDRAQIARAMPAYELNVVQGDLLAESVAYALQWALEHSPGEQLSDRFRARFVVFRLVPPCGRRRPWYEPDGDPAQVSSAVVQTAETRECT